jgi:hypothetical protein
MLVQTESSITCWCKSTSPVGGSAVNGAKISGIRDGFLDRFNPVFDGRLRYVLLSAEGALDRSLGWSEAEPQESARSRGQALKERWSRLWKWNPARLICRPFRAGSVFYAFPGVPLRSAASLHPRLLSSGRGLRRLRLRASVLGHDQKQVNGLGEPSQNRLIFAPFTADPNGVRCQSADSIQCWNAAILALECTRSTLSFVC